MIVCDTSQKPLTLFHIVHSRNVEHALVFTKSAESTTRLVRLFAFFEEAWRSSAAESDKSQRAKAKVVCAYSSDLSGPERKQILEKFKQGEIDMSVSFLFRNFCT
jgi:ATP-dependent RNA helicase DDX51/DBP6